MSWLLMLVGGHVGDPNPYPRAGTYGRALTTTVPKKFSEQ
jgi:hypothetical protein